MDTNNEYFKAFQKDIDTAWTNKLLTEFHLQNQKVHKHLDTSLKIPNFVFTTDNKVWGTWQHKDRIITLSYKLLRDFEWDALVHTLKHEMAHMVTSEIWGDISDNGNSHGELFKKACEILEVDTSKTQSSQELASYRIPEKDKIVSKVYKLFCLGESNHKAEAETAIAKAHELMIKHNITLKDLPNEKRVFIARPVGKFYKNVPAYVKNLSRIITQYYFVKHIFYSTYAGSFPRRGLRRYVELFGEPSNIDIADYIYHFLLCEGEKQWKEFQKTDAYKKRFENDYNYGDVGCLRRSSKYSKVAFLTGLYNGFARTLEKRNFEVKAQINVNNALPICLDDPLLEEKYNEEYHPKTWHSNSGSRKDGYSEGHAIGQSIQIRNGISTVSNKLLLNS